MRLIDADNFLERFEKMCETETDNVIAAILKGALINEPTAYDIDKVVEELEEIINPKEMYFCRVSKGRCIHNEDDIECIDCVAQRAIEIVKQGGVSDDVCEWKQTSTAKYKTSCGYKLEEYFDTNACYCKQCGKKIKVAK